MGTDRLIHDQYSTRGRWEGPANEAVICDARPDRRHRLIALTRSASDAIQVVSRELEQLDGLRSCPVALLAVEFDNLQELDHGMAPILAAIRKLTLGGVPVLCYGDGSTDWPLAQRCQVLLAGAPVLFDSASHSFDFQLAAELTGRLRMAAGAQEVDRRVAEVMLHLGIIGRSSVLKVALLAIERSARLTDMPVLLLGESGTGKELLARAVHILDRRRRQHPFVPVNCAALTKTLAEAELFGHRKGAYSGADRERPGLIRAAEGGVLFLDEVGELDLEVQAKLLRVIQERRVLTLGDWHETAVDVRVVAATHQNLREMVRQGRFRGDLLNRLWVYPVEIPPLRRRRDDIRGLVEFFVLKHASDDRVIPKIGADFVEALEHASLEGNVRQLESIVQRAVALADGYRALGLADLPPELWAELVEKSPQSPPPESPLPLSPLDLNLARSLALEERRLVEAALQISRGNQARAATLLGITARSMYTKLRKHRLGRAASATQ